MYFSVVLNWVYHIMHIPIPIVVSPNSYGLVTVFDIFIFTVYVGVFIVLVKYVITDSLDIKIGDTDINYSSSSYLSRRISSSKDHVLDPLSYKIPDNSIAGRILKNRK